MKRQRFQFSAALFAVVADGNRFLSVRRSGTGWMDGRWSLPAGAHDGNESYITGALRELKEEAGLLANPDDCRLLHVQQVFTGSDEWMGVYIGIARFSGMPRLMEPEKHDCVEWRSLTAQSEPVVPYVLAALKEISLGSALSTYSE
jgi:8-oxo-dGTP diphosphatase